MKVITSGCMVHVCERTGACGPLLEGFLSFSFQSLLLLHCHVRVFFFYIMLLLPIFLSFFLSQLFFPLSLFIPAFIIIFVSSQTFLTFVIFWCFAPRSLSFFPVLTSQSPPTCTCTCIYLILSLPSTPLAFLYVFISGLRDLGFIHPPTEGGSFINS